jgi:hypothetical protein
LAVTEAECRVVSHPGLVSEAALERAVEALAVALDEIRGACSGWEGVAGVSA